jgi:Permuted papain-like amidase enzyme, YaeF/YiiX, C92 family
MIFSSLSSIAAWAPPQMHITRRLLVSAAAILPLSRIGVTPGQEGNESLPLPRQDTFQSGDLVWPKKPGAYVPYRSITTDTSAPTEEERWTAEREAFLKSPDDRKSHLTSSQIDELRNLTFREFYARYAGDQKPGIPGAYASGGGIYVGHVGIVDIDPSSKAWIIEALLDRGVVRTPYDQWLKLRPGEVVWHGRVRELPLPDRQKIVAEATKNIGKPYDFWNFDLNDDRSFYCSKLVWLSIWRALGFAIDGNSNPWRGFWFSPKQLLYASTVTRLHDPGPYARQ